jgi:hypothetical protein
MPNQDKDGVNQRVQYEDGYGRAYTIQTTAHSDMIFCLCQRL